MKTETTYIERADKMASTARVEIFREIRREWAAAQAEKSNIERILVDCVNRYSRIGGLLVEAAGHEQLGFTFWRTHLEKQLPFDFETTQRCMAIHRKIPHAVTSVEETMKVLQPTFITAGLLTMPEGGEPGSPAARPPLTWFINEMNDVRQRMDKWFADEPLEEAPVDRLDTIIARLTPIVDVHQRAMELRSSKYPRPD